jgi:hypothetical protein
VGRRSAESPAAGASDGRGRLAATESAFYQREEVAAAIELARRESHRVVPVFVDGPPSTDDVPYGLRRIHHAVLSDSYTVEDVARQLLDLIPGDSEGAGPLTRTPGSVPLVLSVAVPSETDDAGTPVYIAGTLDLLDGDLPHWDPAGVRLTRVDSTLWSIELSGVPGTTVAYKYTLGSWVRVEKDAHGEEIDDRRLTVESGPEGAHRQEDEVERWQDIRPDRRDP